LIEKTEPFLPHPQLSPPAGGCAHRRFIAAKR